MSWSRQTRGLAQSKLRKPQIKQNAPLPREGNSGEVSIRNVSSGVFSFFKALGTWFKVFNNKNHMIPDKPNTYDIGSPKLPWRSGYFSNNSIYIGNQKANRIKLGVSGTGESVKLKVITPAGKVVADENESLQAVDGDVDLTDTTITAYAVGASVVEDGNTLTIGTGVEFDVVALDPSADEEARIDKRLRFDVEMRNYIRFIDNKFTWFKDEFATMPLFKHNALVDLLNERDVVLDDEVDDYKAKTLNVMQGYWTFTASTNTWTFNNLYGGGGATAHGLSINSQIMFTDSASSPSEFDRFRSYFVHEDGFTSTTIRLKVNAGIYAGVIGGASDSTAGSVSWRTVDKTALANGTPPGYLPSPDKNYSSYIALPGIELVEGENYTNVDFLHDNVGGVCIIGGEASTHTTQYSCERDSGTWYP